MESLEDLRVEVERLKRWKAEATEVIRGLQDLGKALRLSPGLSITGRTAAEAAELWVARAEKAEAECRDLCQSDGDVRARLADAEKALARVRAETTWLKSQVPPCDGECSKWGEPQEDCSRDGRPVAQVWEMFSETGERHRNLRAKIEELADLWERGIPEGPAAIHFCPEGCGDIWETEPTCGHESGYQAAARDLRAALDGKP